jgi:hypothetical protein
MCSAVMHAELDFTRNVLQPQTPTWETYEIMKYGKVGTSLYTGTINYSIPLYSYTDQEIQIQLALSYAT